MTQTQELQLKAIELGAYVAGDDDESRPTFACPRVLQLLRLWHDGIGDNSLRAKLLYPVLDSVPGTGGATFTKAQRDLVAYRSMGNLYNWYVSQGWPIVMHVLPELVATAAAARQLSTMGRNSSMPVLDAYAKAFAQPESLLSRMMDGALRGYSLIATPSPTLDQFSRSWAAWCRRLLGEVVTRSGLRAASLCVAEPDHPNRPADFVQEHYRSCTVLLLVRMEAELRSMTAGRCSDAAWNEIFYLSGPTSADAEEFAPAVAWLQERLSEAAITCGYALQTHLIEHLGRLREFCRDM